MTPVPPCTPPVKYDVGWLALPLACLVGAGLRLWNLGGPSLYTDEAYTLALAGLPLPSLLAALGSTDYHPPFFYVLTHVLLQTLHWPPWDYRYITAPLGVVTIAATWGAARRMFGVTAAAVSSILVALSPALITYDRLYRMYVLLVAASALSWWLLLEAQHATSRRRIWLWVAYGLVTLVMCFTHYLGLLVFFCQIAYALTRVRTAAPIGVVALVVALAYLPWLRMLLRQLPLGGVVISRPGIDAGLAASVRGAFASGAPDSLFSWSAASWVPLIVVVAIIIVGAWLGWRTALPFWLAALPLAVAASIVLDKNLAYFSSYLLIDIPPVAIAFGAIVQALALTRVRVAALALSLVAVATQGAFAANVLLDPYYQFPDWYAVNAAMLTRERPGDAIVLDAAYEFLVVHNYTAFAGRPILQFMNPSNFASIEQWIRGHPQHRVWYVQHQNFYWDPNQRIEAALSNRKQLFAKRFVRQSPVNDVTVILFDKSLHTASTTKT